MSKHGMQIEGNWVEVYIGMSTMGIKQIEGIEKQLAGMDEGWQFRSGAAPSQTGKVSITLHNV